MKIQKSLFFFCDDLKCDIPKPTIGQKIYYFLNLRDKRNYLDFAQ